MLRPICLYILFVLLLITGSDGFSQQLKLGKNPSAVIKSAVLELESSNQGLLFPRLTDTAGINLFSPPDGMVIYLTTAKQLYVRSNGRWSVLTSGIIDTTSISNFYVKVRSLHAGTAPITYNNTTGVVGITQASSTSAGYLSAADWNTFNSKLSSITQGNLTETGSGVLTITGGTNAVVGSGTSIQVKQASGSQNGFLSSTDWTTFNNKQSALSGTGFVKINGTTISYDNNTYLTSIDTSNIALFYQKVRGLFAATAPITYNTVTGTIGITQASSTTPGYLSAADWNTFNSKGSGNGTVTSVLVTTANGVSGTVTNPTTTPAISLTLGAITPTSVAATGTVTGSNLSGTNTGNVTLGTANGLSLSGQALSLGLASTSATGALSSTDWNTFNNKLSSVDTSNIPLFYQKVRGLFSATSPITLTNGAIGITQASGTTAGYLSAADWTTFNNKLSSNNVWTRQGNAGTNPGTDFIGTTDAQDLIFKTASTERWRIENSSGDIKIGSSTSGTFKATKELVMREDGDTYGASILRLRNRNGENGAIFETTTTDPGATLVDFIFKTSVDQRNIRYESRSTYSLVGVPAFHIAGSNPDVPTLAVGDNYAAVKNYLKVGAYTTPAEVLDVSGNVKLSGALMPGGSAGTSGQILQSNGTGAAPTWVNSPSSPVTNDDYVYSYATAAKTFSSAGTWVDITIDGGNGPISGWTHSTSSNAQNFTCNQTGIYQISYSGQVVNTNSTVRELAIRAVLDGTEIAGSANSTECSSNANTSLNNTFLVSVTSGQVLKLQLTGSNNTIRLTAGGYGTTKPSVSITVIRIK